MAELNKAAGGSNATVARSLERNLVLAALLSVSFSGLASVMFPSAALSSVAFSSPTFPRSVGAADEQVVIVLKDGTELAGVLVRESETEVAIRSTFGVTTISLAKVKEIRRGENPWGREFQTRFDRAKRLGKAQTFADLGDWAMEKGLTAEGTRAYEAAIGIDPQLESARGALGHGRLDGRWVDARRVAELEQEGYELRGLDLVERAAGAPPQVTDEPEARKLTPEEAKQKKKEEERHRKALEKRREKREKFEKQRLAEFKGVPWGSAHKIRSPHYEIVCNSTREVAQTYSTIMEALYGALSLRFKQKHVRSGRMTVFIYKTQQEFMNRTGMGANTGGFYRPDNEQVHGYHGTFGNTATTYNVLAHEGTHQFQGRVLPRMTNMNNWIIEGFAVYFGDGSRIDYKKKKIVTGIIPRDRLLHIQDKMREDTHTPLTRLAGLPRNRFGGSQYADSWAILYFLLNGPDKKKGQEFISRYWLLGTEQRVGQSEFDELADYYFGGVDKLEAMYKEFILDLEPEAAGEVDDDGTFTSTDFMFEILRPEGDWKYRLKGLRRTELVALIPENPLAKFHRVYVSLLTKQDENQSPSEYVEAVLLPALESAYENVTSESVTLNEYSCYVIECVDPDPNQKKAKEKKDGEAEEEEAVDKKPPPRAGPFGRPPVREGAEKDKDEPEQIVRRKMRAYVIVGVTNAYLIVGEAPIEEFSKILGPFEQVASSFARILKNRW